MFQLPLPLLEKLLRPVIVYLVLVLLLRLFGKRQELAQLNPFDLVVLLSLWTPSDAIIGDDNSVTGGGSSALSASSRLTGLWCVCCSVRRGSRACLRVARPFSVRNGQIDVKALERESLTREELVAVIHKQGFEHVHQVRVASWSRTAASMWSHSSPLSKTSGIPT